MKPLSWTEPRPYRRRVNLESHKLAGRENFEFAVVSFAVLLAIRWTAGLHPSPDQHPPDWQIVIPAVAVVSLMIAFLLPIIMLWIATAIVVVSDLGINHNVMWGRGWRHNFWSWDEVESTEIGTEMRSGQSFRVLGIQLVNGERICLAVSPQVRDEDLVSAFAARGRQITPK